jgi:cytochrome c553
MRKAAVASIVLLAVAGPAVAQQLPHPLPEDDPHAAEKADAQYPSARVCGECHPRQFEQWSISSHAYANVSPMFNKFEQKINDLASGTIGSFCVRCHASVGTALAERRDIAWWNRNGASREGITCVTCHRVGEAYGKGNAARRITPGPIHEAVFGPFDTTGGVAAVSHAKDYGILVTQDEPDRPDEPGKEGQPGKKWIRMHLAAVQSTIIKQS